MSWFLKSRVVFPLILLAIAMVTFGWAQDYRGKVQGIVGDSSGAMIPGAEVVLTNVHTAVEQRRPTGEEGHYVFDFVEPGKYRLMISMPGFKSFVQENVDVTVRGDVTVNARLDVGEVAETVTVTAPPVAVQFNTSTIELTVDQRMLTDLPVSQRNPFALAYLDASVTGATASSFFPWMQNRPSGMSVGGTVDPDILIDGAPIRMSGLGGAAKISFAPPMDSVQEFTVQQNSVDAESGYNAGSVISVAMKSGTNQYHGTLSYLGRNPKLNAVSSAVSRTPNMVRNHIWSGTLGNPIVKDKLFTFTSFEVWRQNQPAESIMTMPTELERNGDFSQSYNSQGNLRLIYDPWSTVFDSKTGKAARTPFPNNTIPAARMDPTALIFLKDLWLPNGPGDDITGVNNFKQGWVRKYNFWSFSNRTDWNVGERWKMFGRFSHYKTDILHTDFTGINSIAGLGGGNDGVRLATNIAADAVFTMNPTTVLNFRGNYNFMTDDFGQPSHEVGKEGLANFWPDNPWYQSYLDDRPRLFYPKVGLSGRVSIGQGTYWWQHPQTWNFSARVSKSQGRHYWKTGGETRLRRGSSLRTSLMEFNFVPGTTADTFISPNTKLSGDSMASFLLGAVSSGAAAWDPRMESRHNFYALYVQDDFKLNRWLTLNLGLRWEYETGPGDSQGRLSRYLDLTDPIPEFQSSPPAMPAEVTALLQKPHIFNGAWVFTDSEHRRGWDSSKASFTPRLGLAYRVDDSTALRIGWARSIQPPTNQINTMGGESYDGYSVRTPVSPELEGRPGTRLSDPFPASNPLLPSLGQSLGRYTNLGSAASWQLQDFKTATHDRFNFSLQRQLPDRLFVDFTYFLNLGRDMPYTLQRNMVDPQIGYTVGAAAAKTVNNPFYKILTADTFPGALRNQAKVTVGSLLAPYPQYGSLQQMNTPGVLYRYHALQFTAKQLFNRGYQGHFSYSYNRTKTYEFYDDIAQYNGDFTFIGSANPRHRLAGALLLDLPVGQERHFLTSAHPILNAVIGGWSLNPMVVWNSGRFLRFGGMVAKGNPILDNPSRALWFDTSMFEKLPAYTPRSNPWQYEGLTGPGSWNLDVSCSKSFTVMEGVQLQVRMEAYNLTNSFMPGDPNVSVTSSLFGRSTSQANTGRELQYVMRILF